MAIESSWTDAQLITLWNEGNEQAEIARITGLSRERVRQRLRPHGLKGKNPNALPSEQAILAALKDATSLDALAAALSVTVVRVLQAADRSKLRTTLDQTLKANRQKQTAEVRLARQAEFVRTIRAIAVQRGRTPTTADLEANGLFAMQLHQTFGSVQQAMTAAGLRANRPGRQPEMLPEDFDHDVEPTENERLLHERAARLRLSGTTPTPPAGIENPEKVNSTGTAFRRSPAVVAWVLQEAGGICEACGAAGYETDDGTVFLEVHHVLPLGEGGPDTVDNAVAVCETCHGKLHKWKHRAELRQNLLDRLLRLKQRAQAV